MARTQIDNRLLKSRNLTGASLVSELGFYDETKNYTSGDPVIWQNEKYICNTNITGTTEGDLSNTPDVSSDWDKLPNVSYSAYPSSSETISQSRTTLSLDTERYSSPYCSLSNSEITLQSPGVFIISVSFAVSNSTNTRHSASCFVQIDTGSGFNDIPDFEINVYSRNTSDGITTGSLSIPVKFNSGDKIRLQGISNNDTAISSYPSGCNITIFGLDAVSGPRGAQGIAGPSGDLKWKGTYSSSNTYNQYDTVEHQGSCYTCLNNSTTSEPPSSDWDLVALKGADGAGSSITVSEDSTNIPNTPHSTLNFVGDITATDSGSGIADITVKFPKNTYMFPVWAEENSTLRNNTFEWAFGNGANTPSGNGMLIYVPSGYKCELVAMSLVLRQGTATVSALKNTTVLSGAEVSVNSGQSNTAEFTPVEYMDKDIINFKTKSASNTGSPNVVTAWFRFTEL